MPFIWNDETYWERVEKSKRFEKIILLFFIINILLFYFFINNKIEIKELIILSFTASFLEFSILDLFKKYRLPYIPDTYSEGLKQLMRIIHILILSLVMYWMAIHYSLV